MSFSNDGYGNFVQLGEVYPNDKYNNLFFLDLSFESVKVVGAEPKKITLKANLKR